MSLNRFIVQGRIPSSDKLPFELINKGTDDKTAVLRGMVSVQRSYKKEGEQYYPEDLLFFKAFGATAVFIEKYFNRGDNLILEGEIRKDDDYQKDGQTVRGQMYLHVIPNGCYFQKGNPKDGEEGADSSAKSAAPAKASPAKSNPLGANKAPAAAGGLNPLKKRSVI